jgi:hypothetical protein
MCRQQGEDIDIPDRSELPSQLGANGVAVVVRFHKYCGVIRICEEQLFLTEKLRRQSLRAWHLL